MPPRGDTPTFLSRAPQQDPGLSVAWAGAREVSPSPLRAAPKGQTRGQCHHFQAQPAWRLSQPRVDKARCQRGPETEKGPPTPDPGGRSRASPRAVGGRLFKRAELSDGGVAVHVLHCGGRGKGSVPQACQAPGVWGRALSFRPSVVRGQLYTGHLGPLTAGPPSQGCFLTGSDGRHFQLWACCPTKATRGCWRSRGPPLVMGGRVAWWVLVKLRPQTGGR